MTLLLAVLQAVASASPIDAEGGFRVLLTPTAIVGVGAFLGRLVWVMHSQNSQKLGAVDQALRGYDGDGGLLYDIRQIREARHAEANSFMSLQGQVSLLQAQVTELARQVADLANRTAGGTHP